MVRYQPDIERLNADRAAAQAGRRVPTIPELLDFERDWTGTRGQKEAEIRTRFHCSLARYYQLLHRAIDSPIALEHDPITTHRIQRQRDAATRIRAGRTLTRKEPS